MRENNFIYLTSIIQFEIFKECLIAYFTEKLNKNMYKNYLNLNKCPLYDKFSTIKVITFISLECNL